jgi:hypothetical protein
MFTVTTLQNNKNYDPNDDDEKEKNIVNRHCCEEKFIQNCLIF